MAGLGEGASVVTVEMYDVWSGVYSAACDDCSSLLSVTFCDRSLSSLFFVIDSLSEELSGCSSNLIINSFVTSLFSFTSDCLT